MAALWKEVNWDVLKAKKVSPMQNNEAWVVLWLAGKVLTLNCDSFKQEVKGCLPYQSDQEGQWSFDKDFQRPVRMFSRGISLGSVFFNCLKSLLSYFSLGASSFCFSLLHQYSLLVCILEAKNLLSLGCTNPLVPRNIPMTSKELHQFILRISPFSISLYKNVSALEQIKWDWSTYVYIWKRNLEWVSVVLLTQARWAVPAQASADGAHQWMLGWKKKAKKKGWEWYYSLNKKGNKASCAVRT